CGSLSRMLEGVRGQLYAISSGEVWGVRSQASVKAKAKAGSSLQMNGYWQLNEEEVEGVAKGERSAFVRWGMTRRIKRGSALAGAQADITVGDFPRINPRASPRTKLSPRRSGGLLKLW